MFLASRCFPLLVLSLAGAAFSTDPVPYRLLSMRTHYQEQSSWCWAASDEMVLDFFGRDQAQCQIADVAKANGMCGVPGTCCGGNYYACNLGCSPLIGNIVPSISWSQAISWGTATGEIDLGRPFIFVWNWDTGGSHAMVAKGYFNSPYFWIEAADPIRGDVAYPQTQIVSHSGGVWFGLH